MGEGAQFWFTVPALRAREVVKFEAVALTADASPPSGLSFLIALADETLCKPIVDYLEPFGNRLVVTGALAEAIGRAGRENFDAIIASAVDADMLAVLDDPQTKAKMAAQAVVPAGSSPQALRQWIADETDRWRKVIAEAGIKPD